MLGPNEYLKPSIALLELGSIARGVKVLDAMVKQAPIDVLSAGLISSGKYAILIGGHVAEVEESVRVGKEIAAQALIGCIFLPQIHHKILPGLRRVFDRCELDSLGILETSTAVNTITACDKALKGADVTLIDLRIEKRLGGKGYFIVSGSLDNVEAAIELSVEGLESGTILGQEIIPRPDEQSWGYLFSGSES